MIGRVLKSVSDLNVEKESARVVARSRHQDGHRIALRNVGAVFGVNDGINRLQSIFRIGAAATRQLHRGFDGANKLADALRGDFGELCEWSGL
jgi:hypothetical protein